MKNLRKVVWWLLIIAAPVLAGALWLASGREVLTKRQKSMEVEVRDEVFGDTITRAEFVPGPVLGYFVGLDVVVGTTGASLLGCGVFRWISRRNQRKHSKSNKGERHDG